ncbi:LacI family DNA-binding transcriptional regulator [Microbacterium sp. RD1]|uniref:LacI family DNA-binding transcriptional regulator n=1 Tax=Microbacterium sp. RD1 TaxID=3457313 RepID=UPI003FA56974
MRTPRATVKDVASLAAVSPKTVSNVLTGSVRVRPETRSRVEAAMRALDFVPNLSARRLRSGRSGTIGVALPELATEFSADLLHYLVEEAHERGFAVQVDETARSPQREQGLLSRARAHLLDGLILNPVRLEDSVIDRVDDLPPVVLIGEVEQHRTDRVLIDSRRAAADVTAHLLARGCRRIAVVGGDERPELATATSRLRLAGFHDALARAGLQPHPAREINVPWSMAGGAAALRELTARGVEIDAVVAFTDSLAVGVMHELARAGRRVPQDVRLSGFDDVEIARFTTPALTTVGFDRRRFAAEAVRLLAERIETGDLAPRQVTIPHRLVERDSTLPAG